MNTKWLTPSKFDGALQEFKVWVREMGVQHPAKLHDFQYKTNRLDDFDHCYMGNHEQFVTIWYAFRLLLILSHG